MGSFVITQLRGDAEGARDASDIARDRDALKIPVGPQRDLEVCEWKKSGRGARK